jgi:glutamate racemase
MSANALDIVANEVDIPIVGVVESSVRRAIEETKHGRIGVIGTTATIKSGAYERLISALAPDAQVFSAACPLFVPLVENGRYSAGDVAVEAIASDYLKPLAQRDIDTLILGCTHYPLLRDVISGVMGPCVKLVDAGEACAVNAASLLRREDMLCDENSRGGCRFFVSDDPGNFSSIASVFLGCSVSDEIEQVDISSY